MGKATSKSGYGSGWHKQSQRHSNARKYGKAGGKYLVSGKKYGRQKVIGRYSTFEEAKKNYDKHLFEKGWKDFGIGDVYLVKEPNSVGHLYKAKDKKEAIKKHLKKFGESWSKQERWRVVKDSDGDGVPDHKDCQPNNPNKQGLFHKHKNKLELEINKAIKKETDPKKKEELKKLKEELKEAESISTFKSFIQRNKIFLKSLGVVVGSLVVASLLVGEVPYVGGLVAVGAGLRTVYIGAKKIIITGNKYIDLHNLSDNLQKRGIPEKKAKDIAKRIINLRASENVLPIWRGDK